MANQGNGRNVAMPDENQPSWRPQDENGASRNRRNISMRDDDEDERYSARDRERMGSHWEDNMDRPYGGYGRGQRSTEYGGQGQSGYGAGRYEGDHAYGSRNQSSMMGETRDRGLDERWSGGRSGDTSYSQHDRGSGSYYGQQGGYGAGGYGDQGYRNYGSERGFPSGTFDNEGHYSERQGQHHRYQSSVGHYGHPGQGGYGQGFGQGGPDMGAGGYLGQGGQQMGYGNSLGGQRGYEGQQYGTRGPQSHSGYPEGAQGGPQQDRYGSQGYQGWDQSGRQGYGLTGQGQGIGAAAGGWNQQGSSIGQMNDMRQMHGGQMGMHRGKGPSGYTRSDDRIKEIVCEVLTDDHHIDATNIEVAVKNGEVTLTGTVEDRQQKRRAEDVVEHLSCVKDVQNQLRVQSAEKRSSSAVDRSGPEQTQTSTSSSSDKRHRA